MALVTTMTASPFADITAAGLRTALMRSYTVTSYSIYRALCLRLVGQCVIWLVWTMTHWDSLSAPLHRLAV